MLKNRCAFITGGASGIAFATAKRFLQEGAKVTIGDICAEEKRNAAVEELSQYGEVYGVYCDVTDGKTMEAAIDYAAEKMGKVDIGANFAFLPLPVGNIITEYKEENFLKALTVNLYGMFLSVKYEAKKIMECGCKGSIINCSSINAFLPTYGYGVYCSSKAGINSLSNVAAIELGKYGIRVNHVCPGFTSTAATAFMLSANDKMIPDIMDHLPLKKINEPEEVADSFVFLASDMSSQITGAEIVIDGGMQHMGYPQQRRYMMPEEDFIALYK